jgi:hypothetical protein
MIVIYPLWINKVLINVLDIKFYENEQLTIVSDIDYSKNYEWHVCPLGIFDISYILILI